MTDHTASRYAGDPRVTEIEPGRIYHLQDHPYDPPWIVRYSFGSNRWHVCGPDGDPETDVIDDTLDDAIYNVAGLALWEVEAHLITHAVAMDGWLAASYCGPIPEYRYAMTGLAERGIFAFLTDLPATGGRYAITPDGMDLYDQIEAGTYADPRAHGGDNFSPDVMDLLDGLRAEHATT